MPGDTNRAGLDPIEGAYRVALLMTGDASVASSLVETAVRQLRKDPAYTKADVPSEVDIVRLMWRLRHETFPPALLPELARGVFATHREARAMARARSRIVGVLDRVEPNVLTILYLLEVRQLPADVVAEITGQSPVEVMTALSDGLAAIHDAVFGGAEAAERASIIEDLPDSWLQDALANVFDQLGPAPESLRQAVSTEVTSAAPDAAIPSVTGPHLPSERTGPAQPTIRFRALVVSVILILSVGFGARFLYDQFATSLPERNAIALAVHHASRFIPDLETDSPERAHRYLLTHLGENVPLPDIRDADLTGTAMGEIAKGGGSGNCQQIPMPCVAVLRYQDRSTGEPITIYALTYRFLDAHAEDIELSTDVRRQIQSETNFDLHNLGRDEVLVWRHRSYVLLAVTSIDARRLRERIQMLTESGLAP